MTSPTSPPPASEATPSPGQPVRSEGLLPDSEDDRAPEVAEEVNLDQQSGRARQVGTASDDAAGALAEALQPEPSGTSGAPEKPLDDALKERLPPPQ